MTPDEMESLAAIEYVGLPGISKECQDAVIRLLQCRDSISLARILSSDNDHCLLLTVNVGDLVAVKSGFASGYRGEGSHTFSYVLQLLDAHGTEIDEIAVTPDLFERIDASCLTKADLELINRSRSVRPTRWQDYIFERDWDRKSEGTLWREFPLVIPFAIVDARLVDLALTFWSGPDSRLLDGYRRLEDVIRARTGLKLHGQKLFSQCFLGPNAVLCWGDIDEREQAGRAGLFISAFGAHRNPRAHKEQQDDSGSQLSEFLLLNHLFRLESELSDKGFSV
jgi:hypothetical protein